MDATTLKTAVDAVAKAVGEAKNEDAIKGLRDLIDKPSPSEEDLRVSKAGQAIAKLRKNANKEVAKLASDIVAKWKQSVDANKKKRKLEDGGDKDGAGPADAKKTKLEDGKAGAASSETSAGPAKKERKLSTISAEPTQERSTKTDNPKDLKPKYLPGSSEAEDKVRDRGVTMYYDALAFDSIADNEVLVERAIAIEEAVFNKMKRSTGNDYRSSVRELFLNLREPSNAALRDSIVTGNTSAKDLVNFTQEELASETIKAEQAAIDKQNLFAAQAAGATEAETDAFKCGKCGQHKTRYYQMQTRSADEPMTTFVTCTNCNNRWKFS